MKRLVGIFFSVFFFLSFLVTRISAQDNRQNYRLFIFPTDDLIEVDGKLDEPVWKTAGHAENFHRVLPIDTGFATHKTEVIVTYNDDHFYMAIICWDTLPGKRPVESLRRDFAFGRNENFLAFIDTYNDKTNGFSFGISSSGAQWDGIQSNGGAVSLDWDCKWKSAVQNYPDRWVAEFEIPFRSIRYREGVGEWGINFSRLALKGNEKSSWAPVPRQFPTANLAFTGTLVWDNPPPKLGTRFSVIPYVSGRGSQNVEAGEKINPGGDVGLDAKVTLSTSMNLDLTLNPDFSQVEVDQQVTNLDRFELFFPERRQFFLENSDLFASLGTENIRPFFSRRIGLQSPVYAGARLSGKLGENWRLGLMNMQTGSTSEVPATNFGVIALQRKIFTRSNVGVFMVNKEITASPKDSIYRGYAYNRVAGFDLNLANASNRWTGKIFYHQAFYPDAGKDAFALAGNVTYNTPTLLASWNQAWVGADYLAETGFVRRKGFFRTNPEVKYKFFPANSSLANHGPGGGIEMYFDPQGKLTDRITGLNYSFNWLNLRSITAEIRENYVRLLTPFDPTNTGGDTLARGTDYQWNEALFTYISDSRKLLNYELTARYGGFFNGERISLGGRLTYRVQPYANLALTASWNKIVLPEPYTSATLILIGPRLDLTFTNKLFLTTFVQYNNQIDNINVNIRLQWRYAPVSDLFIVFTDNAYPENFRTKNRALVLKLSYWLN
ncbi:MAG: DUF5916 domain-containing protein [Bacteroidia bacterium]|nr:DUF5916 domain-containing protein [Bacteroidia bacterium]